MAGYCRLWILGYAELAKPLYEATKEKAPWAWGPDQQKAFEELKTALLRALALALPDHLKPFTLFGLIAIVTIAAMAGVALQTSIQTHEFVAQWQNQSYMLWPTQCKINEKIESKIGDLNKLYYG
jgi:hypothetical protein